MTVFLNSAINCQRHSSRFCFFFYSDLSLLLWNFVDFVKIWQTTDGLVALKWKLVSEKKLSDRALQNREFSLTCLDFLLRRFFILFLISPESSLNWPPQVVDSEWRNIRPWCNSFKWSILLDIPLQTIPFVSISIISD